MGKRLIYADDLSSSMYHEAFETDTDMQKWDSGCWIRYKMFERQLEAQPTVDAEPVKHGRWEQAEVVHDRKDAKIQDWQQAKCSVCGRWQTTPFMYYLKLDNYCPNCGAKMDGEGRKENE